MVQECQAATGSGRWEQQVIFGRKLGVSRLDAATATLKLLSRLAFIPVSAASRNEKRDRRCPRRSLQRAVLDPKKS
jgi:hypothetical protein